MQSLCEFTHSMASRQIRRLKEQVNLLNIGKPAQPIYVVTLLGYVIFMPFAFHLRYQSKFIFFLV